MSVSVTETATAASDSVFFTVYSSSGCSHEANDSYISQYWVWTDFCLSQPLTETPASAVCNSGVMFWSYEEVHAGTCGFCSALKVGEGGFGEVYRASLRNTDCAVKKFRQVRDRFKLLRHTFRTNQQSLNSFFVGFSVCGVAPVLLLKTSCRLCKTCARSFPFGADVCTF